MVNIVLVILLVVCAIGWAVDHIGVLSLSLYIVRQGYKDPTREELAACAREVILNLIEGRRESER